MKNDINKTMTITESVAEYDSSAKQILANKTILAHILHKTIKYFSDMPIPDIIPLIEGEPMISSVPLDPGLTNLNHSKGERIKGRNSEDNVLNEGVVLFDIIFDVLLPVGKSKIIINVEAQKDISTRYDIINRATYYVARLVSSQKDRVFANMDYDEIQSVYSIWICMNQKSNSLTHYSMSKHDIVGDADWKGRTDIMNIVIIGLSEEPPSKTEEYELHHLLSSLFSDKLSTDDKLSVLSDEYDIETEDPLCREVENMCNLGEGILERGIKKGEAIGEARGIKQGEAIGEERGIKVERNNAITKMFKHGISISEIANIYDTTIENITKILKSEHCTV